jgi:hypothetical protein
LDYWGSLTEEIDKMDYWPRYYFSFEAAQTETIAWLETRNQFTEKSVWIANEGNPYGKCCGISRFAKG